MSFLEPKIDDQKDMREGPLFRYPRAEKRLQVTRSTAISSDFSDLKVGKVLKVRENPEPQYDSVEPFLT